MNREASLLPPYISTRFSARCVAGMLLASAAVAWLAVGVNFAEIRRVRDVAGGGSTTVQERVAYELTGRAVRGSQIALVIGTGVIFLTWLYRARVNVRAFGARRLRFSRNWTVLGFLIPFANIVLPYRVIREVWQASDPSTTAPFDWRVVRPGPLLSIWWALFVCYIWFELAAMIMTLSGSYSYERLQLTYGMALVADVAAALAAGLCYFVVVRISDAQERKWELLAAGESPSWSPGEPGETGEAGLGARA